MERLTEWDGCNHPVINGLDDRKLTACLDNTECNRLFKAEKKLAEYEDLEEQGKLLKLPCKAGDTVWYISEKVEKRGRKRATVLLIDEGVVDNITLGCAMKPQITVCNNENTWDTFDCEDFGKSVFLTKEGAEAALERMGTRV